MLTSFGKFSRKLRIDHGELLKEMANKLGVTSAYLSAVEVGKRSVPEDWINKIAVIYGLAAEEVMQLRIAYDQTVTQLKIDLSNQTPKHREAAMVFAREFKEMDENEINEFLRVIEHLKNKSRSGCDE